MRKCVLEDKLCTDCGECDICDLDRSKICDSCGKCIEPESEFAEIEIDGIAGGD